MPMDGWIALIYCRLEWNSWSTEMKCKLANLVIFPKKSSLYLWNKVEWKKNYFKITCTLLKVNQVINSTEFMYKKLLELSFPMSFKISLNFESNHLDKKYKIYIICDYSNRYNQNCTSFLTTERILKSVNANQYLIGKERKMLNLTADHWRYIRRMLTECIAK